MTIQTIEFSKEKAGVDESIVFVDHSDDSYVDYVNGMGNLTGGWFYEERDSCPYVLRNGDRIDLDEMSLEQLRDQERELETLISCLRLAEKVPGAKVHHPYGREPLDLLLIQTCRLRFLIQDQHRAWLARQKSVSA